MPSANDRVNEISCWTSDFKGQRYLHMQQKPYPDESKRARYVFLPIESIHRLQQKIVSIMENKEQSNEPINVRMDYEVVLMFKEPRTWELKVVPVAEKTKSVSQIDILDLSTFYKALKTIE